MYIRPAAAFAVLSALALLPPAAAAQTLGIGPRMSFVRPDPALGTASDRYSGGALRLKTSPRTAIELAMDWRSTTNDDATVRIRDYPVQASLMLYPVRAAIAPYLLGGVGWYSQRMEALSGADVLSQSTVRRMGYHGGFGGDLRLGARASLFADYRYTFIRFGEDDPGLDNGAGAFGIPGAASLMDHLRLSHEGSMWTGGLVINF
ncbi:MAG TPA: outer membrane beta-barrel protein [Vicinamibacterales bacterium]